MQRKSLYLTLLLILPAIGLVSCEDEPPVIPNPEELITNFILILTPENGGSNVVLSFEDLDGEGGNPPSYLTDAIPANTTFNGAIQILDKTQNPIEDITSEIEEEGEVHQIFYNPAGVALTISYEDMDADGNPIGLLCKVTSGAPGTGTLKVTLRHEPDKTAAGVASGDITHAAGSTDVEVSFPVEIQ